MADLVVTPGAAPAATPPAASSSMLPEVPAVPPGAGSPPAAVPPVVVPPAAAVPPVVPPTPDAPKWFYSDGVPGKGEPPAWYKAGKYANVEAQATAYVELEKRFGAFVGAPAEGKYEFKLPPGVTGELDDKHPLLSQFRDWAAKAQLSQEGFNDVLGMLVQYEAGQGSVDPATVKAEIGERADERLNSVAQWAKANLDDAAYNNLRQALAWSPESASTFKAIEAIVNKTRQPAVPKPGSDTAAAQPQGLAAIQEKMKARDEKGQVKYLTDMAYRMTVEKELAAALQAQAA